MANNITANGRMDLNMVLEKTNLKIHKLILDNLELENAMEQENINTLMEINIQDNLILIKEMDLEYYFKKVIKYINMLEIFVMIK